VSTYCRLSRGCRYLLYFRLTKKVCIAIPSTYPAHIGRIMLCFSPYEQPAAICSCCNLLKAYPVEWNGWGGQLTDLARAGQDGCPRCGFFAKCFASFAPEIFSLGNSFHISHTSIGLKLQRYRDRQSVSLSLDVFLLSGKRYFIYSRGKHLPIQLSGQFNIGPVRVSTTTLVAMLLVY
jgi:hypothetical protein